MIENTLDKVLKNNGVYDSDDMIQEKLLTEMNSLQFIQLIVAIENEFDIGIPDEYLLFQHFSNKESIVRIIEKSILLEIRSVNDIVEKQLCIGCLACVHLCPHGELKVSYEKFPYAVPVVYEECDRCGNCILECPVKTSE